MAFTVWQRAGAMLVNIDHDAEKMAKRLWDANFRVVFPQTHVGNVMRFSETTIRRYIEPYRAMGFTVGHWGYLTGKPSPEVEAAIATMCNAQINATFYVANPEVSYKYSGGDGNLQCGTCFERSEKFCKAFKARNPKMPVGVSSYARFDKEDLHWAAWLNILNARAMPQAYINEVGWDATPELAYKGAIDVKQPHNPMYHPKTGAVIKGFPKSYVHVTIPKPDPEDKYVLTITDWVKQLIRAKAAGHTLGFSCYEAENYSDVDLKILGAAITKYQLAGV